VRIALLWPTAIVVATALVVIWKIGRAVRAAWAAGRWERMVALAALLGVWGGGTAILLMLWTVSAFSGGRRSGLVVVGGAAVYVGLGVAVAWGARRLSGVRASPSAGDSGARP